MCAKAKDDVEKGRDISIFTLEMRRDPMAQVHSPVLWQQGADTRVTWCGCIRGEVQSRWGRVVAR